jgi:hypothetical protein
MKGSYSMSKKKGDNLKLNPAIALGDICTAFVDIPKSYVYEEIRGKFSTVVDKDAEEILKGRKDIPFEEDGRPIYLKYWDIITGAVDLYIKSIENKSIPDSYLRTEQRREEFGKNQNRKIEEIKNRLNANEDKIKNYLNFACETLENLQLQSKIWGNLREEISMEFCRVILSQQSRENIYIFCQNIDAFLLIVEDQSVFEFCEVAFRLKKVSRKILETTKVENNFGGLLNLQNNKCLSKWLTIRTNYYTETGEQKFLDYQRTMLEKEATDELLKKAVKKLNNKLKRTASADVCIPVWLVSLIQLLWNAKNIDLLISFLLCDSANRKRLLETAKVLNDKEGSANL